MSPRKINAVCINILDGLLSEMEGMILMPPRGIKCIRIILKPPSSTMDTDDDVISMLLEILLNSRFLGLTIMISPMYPSLNKLIHFNHATGTNPEYTIHSDKNVA